MRSTTFLGPLMIDIEGTCLQKLEKYQLKQEAVGGVILFARHYESPEQIKELILELRSTAARDILVAVDHEGGRVQRFRTGFTKLPAAAHFLQKTEDFSEALSASELAGWLMAIELRAVGIDFSFAPVLDVDCGLSKVIGDRAFSNRPEQVGKLAIAYRQGMNRAGMAAVGKHFPGHGSVAPDSHFAIPEDNRSFAEIEAHDLIPFIMLFEAGLEGIMPAHVIYNQVDSKPAGFSEQWVGKLLRNQLKFGGAIFSDDLSMEGAACMGDYPQRAKAALQAGCDMILVCNNPAGTAAVLDGNCLQTMAESNERLSRMVGRFPVDREALMRSGEWQQAVELVTALV